MSKVEELAAVKEKIQEGGGQTELDKQHGRGKLSARERIEYLFDKDSFIEVDSLVKLKSYGVAKAAAEGVITGYGTIEGRLSFIYSQDFTVLEGSLGEMHAQKICKIMDMAAKMGAPVIGIIDSNGARIQEGIDALAGYGEIFFKNTRLSGVVPQISIILGPCAGCAAYSPALTDFTFMVNGISHMFLTGPQIIKAVTGEEISIENLGGAQVHNSISGAAHFISQNEKECLDKVKELLGYLPSNNLESPPLIKNNDDLNRMVPEFDRFMPNDITEAYDMRDIIKRIVDEEKFLEVQPYFAFNIITGYGRINGKTIGIVGNQPAKMGGCIDIDASDKSARFIRICDAFNIPVLTFVDAHGFLPGVKQEQGGIIRHGAKMLYAYSQATVPKVTLIVGKAYGGAYIAMGSKELGADIVYAWPGVKIAVMAPEAAANIIFKEEIEESSDWEAARQEKIKEYSDEFASPYIAAEKGYVDDIITPSESRQRLAAAFEMLQNKREAGLPKKHGNFPV
ncbi:acyl-CoA carboxylase subunit beta [Oxobacter pfennigii]|nr:acyl-CoA carboxylase subunit beta [Oxobacter pfennigii]